MCTHTLADLRNRKCQPWAKYSIWATCCGASEGPLLWAYVTSPQGAAKDADVFSERQAARRGTHYQRKYLCTFAFLKVGFLSLRIHSKVDFIEVLCVFGFFNHGSYYFMVTKWDDLAILLLSESFLKDEHV